MEKIKVLVVCGANMQRSQALAHYLYLYALENGFPLEVRSAGVKVDLIKKLQKIGDGAGTFPLNDKVIERLDRERFEGELREIEKEMRGTMLRPPGEERKEKMASLRDKLSNLEKIKGIPITTRHAKPVTKELVEWADVVLAADASVREGLMKLFPRNSRKMQLAKEIASGKNSQRRRSSKMPTHTENPNGIEEGLYKGKLKHTGW